MARLVVLPPSLTGTAPTFQSLAGSPVLTTVAGRAGTHPTLVSLPCLTDVPASRVPTSTPSPRSGSHGSSYPPCVPTSAVVAGYESRFRTFNDRTSGALLGTHESRKERIYGHLRLIEPTERGGWTTCPSRTAPRPIRPLAGCGRDSTVVQLPALHMHVQTGRIEMPANPDPEAMAIADLGVFRYRLVKHFEADGVIDSKEHELVQLFDDPHKRLSLIHRLRDTLEGFMRNGLTRRMRDKANDVGLALVIDANGYPNNIVQFPDQNTQPQQA